MRDFLIAEPKPIPEQDNEPLAHFLSEYSKELDKTLEHLRISEPRTRLSVVLDTPGVWGPDYWGDGAVISVHFEKGGKKVPADKIILGWSLLNYVTTFIDVPPTIPGYLGTGIQLNSNATSAGQSLPILVAINERVESLHFLNHHITVAPTNAQKVYIQPQSQNVGKMGDPTTGATNGCVTIWAWG